MMLYGKTRFNELLDSVEEINSKTLSLRLREMEHDGLIMRHVYSEMPLRVEYELTDKAKNLRSILSTWENIPPSTARLMYSKTENPGLSKKPWK
jgi:DNA-binding HxlR family transcriptional regulator